MTFKVIFGLVMTLLVHFNKICQADVGYHYDRPTATPIRAYTPSYSFGSLPTVVPLPPLPELPPLPTAPPSKYQSSQQALHQYNAPQPTIKSIANSYLSQKQYSVQTPQLINNQPFAHYGQRLPNQQADLVKFPQPASIFSYVNGPPAKPSVNNEQLQAVSQPLRIPYGSQAVVHYSSAPPQEDFYVANGRQLKQYSVVEIIDNDIEQSNEPFLASPFIDSYRARIGASGTGAIPPLPTAGGSIDLRSNAFDDQPRFDTRAGPGEAIALGSGGLGFVRLPNGNIYLGSGSLAYITGQQHSQSVKNARTRTGAKIPDPLHFGHGALGDPFSRNSVYRYK